jgi:hypothetical protein
MSAPAHRRKPRPLGERELGELLICETDFDIAAAGSGEVTFTVTRRSCKARRAARFATSSRRDREWHCAQCPLWVKSGHHKTFNPCPLYPPKAGIHRRERHVRFVAKADKMRRNKALRLPRRRGRVELGNEVERFGCLQVDELRDVALGGAFAS